MFAARGFVSSASDAAYSRNGARLGRRYASALLVIVMYVYVCVCVCYTYVCMYVCMYVCIYIYIYIYCM